MTARHERTGEAGFLLAEMLVTLTISAFVLAGLVGLGALMLRTVDRGIAEIETTDDLSRTLLSLDHLLRSTSRARLDGTIAQLFLFNGDEHHLVLTHRDIGSGAWPVTSAVALRSESDGRLYRSDAALPQKLAAMADLHFGPPRLVYAGGARLRFAYMEQASAGEAPAPPAKLWAVGDRMPSAVTIEAVDIATGRVLVTVRSTIAANADLGCLDGSICGRRDIGGRPKAAPPSAEAGTTP